MRFSYENIFVIFVIWLYFIIWFAAVESTFYKHLNTVAKIPLYGLESFKKLIYNSGLIKIFVFLFQWNFNVEKNLNHYFR